MKRSIRTIIPPPSAWRLSSIRQQQNTAISNMDLKLTRLTAFSVKLPLHEKTYKWADGKSIDVFDATIVRLETNAGVVGWGEATPLGPNYLPAFAEGIRAGLPILGNAILGMNPLSLNQINVVMDQTLKGHPYIKSAIDVACWDIKGNSPTNQSITQPSLIIHTYSLISRIQSVLVS